MNIVQRVPVRRPIQPHPSHLQRPLRLQSFVLIPTHVIRRRINHVRSHQRSKSGHESAEHSSSEPEQLVDVCEWPEPTPADGNHSEQIYGGTGLETVYQCQQVDGVSLPAALEANCNSSSCNAATDIGGLYSSSNLQPQQAQRQQQHQQPPWPPDIPWGVGKVVQVMGLWLLAYIALGQVVVPAMFAVFDIDQISLSARGTALLNLALDVGQVAITVGILAVCTGKYRPKQLGLYKLAWQRGTWLGLVAAGSAVFPVVDWLANSSMTLLSGDGVTAFDMWPTHIESALFDRDWLTCGAYLLVIAVCAPLWEEAVFRGFLLPSLCARLAPAAAVLGSALIFALCHFRAEAFAPLFLLGLVFGVLYHQTRNLLPPMILHSFWNMYVLSTLTLRLRNGLDAPTASAATMLGIQGVLLLMAVGSRPRRTAQSVAASIRTLQRKISHWLNISGKGNKQPPGSGASPAVDCGQCSM